LEILTKRIIDITKNPQFESFVRRYELCSENRNNCEGCRVIDICKQNYDAACYGRFDKIRPPLWRNNE